VIQLAKENPKHQYLSLLPKTKLPTRRTRSNPIHRIMKLGHSRHSRDPLAPQLRQLLPFTRKHIHKPIHTTDNKPLDPILRLHLPLRSEDSDPATRLVVVRNHSTGLHLGLRQLHTRLGVGQRREVVDLDRVVVRRRGDLAGGVESRVADAEAAAVLADQEGDAVCALSRDFSQVEEFSKNLVKIAVFFNPLKVPSCRQQSLNFVQFSLFVAR
jgi:hypothetical protein